MAGTTAVPVLLVRADPDPDDLYGNVHVVPDPVRPLADSVPCWYVSRIDRLPVKLRRTAEALAKTGETRRRPSSIA